MLKRPIVKITLLAFAILLGAFLIVVAMQPGEFTVTRSGVVAAAPETVFPYVNELKKWERWNPWGKIDPEMKITYSGPAAGAGASYSWAGNGQIGEGRMTITESQPGERVQLRIEFIKPMAGVTVSEFTFKPDGKQTTVTWTMSGKNSFVAKGMSLFINMDKMIGDQFEKGLADLNEIVRETAPK